MEKETEKKPETTIETKGSEVKVEITPELAERMEEGFKKLEEKLEKKQKSFAFHGTETSKKELDETTKNKEAVEFIRAVARGDHAKAVEFSDQRAKSLRWGANEIFEANIATKAIQDAAALGAGSDYLVPTVFETQIHASFDNYDELISDADVMTYNKPGYIFKLNELLSNRVIVWPVDESATGLTASQPTYTEPQIAVQDWMGSTDITLDFLEDTEVDIMSDLSRQYGEELAKKLQERLTNGDVTVSGVVTKGILNTAGMNEVLIANTTGGYATVTAQDIENAYFDAIGLNHYQDNNKRGTWYMNALTMNALRSNIRANTTFRDVISIFNEAEMTILGRPVKLLSSFPTPTTTTSDPFIVYGDLKKHLIVRRKRGITMKVNDMGTSRSGRNLNYQLGRELVVSQRIGHQVVLAEGLTKIST